MGMMCCGFWYAPSSLMLCDPKETVSKNFQFRKIISFCGIKGVGKCRSPTGLSETFVQGRVMEKDYYYTLTQHGHGKKNHFLVVTTTKGFGKDFMKVHLSTVCLLTSLRLQINYYTIYISDAVGSVLNRKKRTEMSKNDRTDF